MDIIPTTSTKLSSKHIQLLITIALLELYFENDETIISKFTSILDKQLKTSVEEFKFQNLTVFENFKNKLITTKSTIQKNTNLLTPNVLQNLDNTEIIQHFNGLANLTMYQINWFEAKQLGSGGFGSVYKSFHKIEKKFYAIKKIPIYDGDENCLNEVQIMTTINHENVVKYHSSWIDLTDTSNNMNDDGSGGMDLLAITNGSAKQPFDKSVSRSSDRSTDSIPPLILFIQMELCDETLKEYMMFEHKIADRLTIFKQICNGLNYLHQNGIIHRDLKPDNIFIKNGCAKIGDLGLSKKQSPVIVSNYLSIDINTTIYCAPEPECSFSSDVFSLGIILVELLLKQTMTVHEKRKMILAIKGGDGFDNLVVDECDDLIRKMIAEIPEDRITMEQVVGHVTNPICG